MSALSALNTGAGLARSLAIYYGQPWRRRGLDRFYAGLVGPGALAFDIGAHVGNRTRALARAGARVVAVEPQPALHRFLAATLPRHGVDLVEAAVGAAPGRARLAISRRHPTVSTLSRRWIDTVGRTRGFRHVRWDHEAEVEVVTLDGLIARFGRPDFCKIDVEGHEAQILAGLSQPLPLVATEYLAAALPTAHACVERLASLGPYRFNLVVGEAHAFALDAWLGPGAVAEALESAAAGGRSGDLYARLAP